MPHEGGAVERGRPPAALGMTDVRAFTVQSQATTLAVRMSSVLQFASLGKVPAATWCCRCGDVHDGCASVRQRDPLAPCAPCFLGGSKGVWEVGARTSPQACQHKPRACRVAALGRWKYSRMLQSHAFPPRWSRHPHGAPQRHLRETASGTALTPGALAQGSAKRQRAFTRPLRAETGPGSGVRPSSPGQRRPQQAGHRTSHKRVLTCRRRRS